jgi:hypothetical protein
LLTVVIASVVGPIIVIYYQDLFSSQQPPSNPNPPGTGSGGAGDQSGPNEPVKEPNSTMGSDNQGTKGQFTNTQDNTNSSGQLSISTEKSSYVIDEKVVISGKVGSVVPGQDVRIDVYNSLGEVFQGSGSGTTAKPDIQGCYSADVFLTAHFVNDVVGEYKAVATYNGQSVETKFTVESHA